MSDSPDAVRPERAGFWTLFAAILASSMAFIDGSALNVALPALQRDLGASGAELLWIVNSYTLMLAALILVGGALGDRYGRRRIFALGIVIFTAASLACGLAPNPAFLIFARTLQGLGGALMIPGSLSLISVAFDDRSRGRAIGTWSAVTTITTVIGPALGGVLAEAGLWRLIFFINLPFALPALWALQRHVPESRDEHAPPQLDLAGTILATVGLAGLTYGLIAAPERGWRDPLVWGTVVGGMAALIAFLLVEARSPNAMMPLRMFRQPVFAGANALTLLLYAALYGMLFFLPLNLIQAQGYGETLAGLAALPMVLLLAGLSRRMGVLNDRFGPRWLLTIGPALAGGGFLALGLVGLTDGPGSYWWTFFPGIVLLGLGMAITVTPLTTAVMSSAGEHAGVASGVNNAISRAAGVMAVAMMGALALALFAANLESYAAALNLDPAARNALLAEASKLGAAQPPPGLPESQAAATAQAIDRAFVEMFRILGFIAAGLAWAGALMAAILIRPKT
ncbi:MAG: MFS transporter [Oscillochloris sp.]|nr:MFS transporter [Oscillochloris sp.]